MAVPKSRPNKKSRQVAEPAILPKRTRPSAKDRGLDTAVPPRATRTALELAVDVLENPGAWLRTPHPQFGDRPPIDLIGTDEEYQVYNLLKAVDLGLFS